MQFIYKQHNSTNCIILHIINTTNILYKTICKKFTKDTEDVHTNAYSIIGKEGIVISDINPITGEGQIKVESEIWSAKTEDSQVIPKGTLVTITAIDGVKAVVSTAQKNKVTEKESAVV